MSPKHSLHDIVCIFLLSFAAWLLFPDCFWATSVQGIHFSRAHFTLVCLQLFLIWVLCLVSSTARLNHVYGSIQSTQISISTVVQSISKSWVYLVRLPRSFKSLLYKVLPYHSLDWNPQKDFQGLHLLHVVWLTIPSRLSTIIFTISWHHRTKYHIIYNTIGG